MNQIESGFRLTIRDFLWLLLVVAILCVTQAGLSPLLMTVIIVLFAISAQREVRTRTRTEEQWQQKCRQQQDRINELERELKKRDMRMSNLGDSERWVSEAETSKTEHPCSG